MISEDFAFFGFDQASWERLAALLLGQNQRRGVAVVVVNRAGVPTAAVHTTRGTIDPKTLPAPGDLETLCAFVDAGACIVMRDPGRRDLPAVPAEPLDPSEDFVARVMWFASVLRALGNGSWIRVWPNPLPNVLLGAAPAAVNATDLLVPDGHSVVAGVFESGRLYTGAALRRRGGAFDTLAGPEAIDEWTGPLGGDWRRDHRVVIDAIERELGPIHLGLFAERETSERLLSGRLAGDWARAYATRELVIHPLPGFAAAGLGFDVVRGAAQLAMQVLDGIEPEEIGTIAQGFWRGFTDGQGLEGLLGTPPGALLSSLLDRVTEGRTARTPDADRPLQSTETTDESLRSTDGEPPRS